MPIVASRADVNQKLYVAVESVIGAAVAATKSFPSLSIDPVRVQDDQFYRPAGQLVPGSGVKHRETSEPSYTVGLDYNELAYVFSGLFGAATIANPSGTAYQWVWTPTESNFGTPKTFTVRAGDATASLRIPGYYFNSLNMTLSDDTAEVSGEGFGYAIDDTAGPIGATSDEVQQLVVTGSPTGGTFTLTYAAQTTAAIAYNADAATVQAALQALSNIGDDDIRCYGSGLPDGTITIHFQGTLGATNVAQITSTDSLTGGTTPATAVTTLQAGAAAFTVIPQQPASKNQVNLYMDTTFGGLGTTKYCSALEMGLAIPAIRQPVKVLCTYYPSFKDAVQIAVEEMRASTVLINSTDTIAFLAAYNVGTKPTRYLRYEVIGATITGAHKYTLQIDMAVKCETPEIRRNVQGTYAVASITASCRIALWAGR